MTAYLVTPIVGLALLATVTTACSTTNGPIADTGNGPAATSSGPAATTAGEGSALAKDTKESNAGLAKGELMGTGVGAAAGALYDVKKRR